MLTDVSEVRTASIIRAMMDAVRLSETSVNTYLTTRQYIAEDSKRHSPRRENLKSHKLGLVWGPLVRTVRGYEKGWCMCEEGDETQRKW
jgi:hypothetical protein